MKDIIFLVATVILALVITLIGNYIFILTKKQLIELWIGTALFIIVVSIYSSFTEINIFSIAFFFLMWFSITRIGTNLLNKDNDIIRN